MTVAIKKCVVKAVDNYTHALEFVRECFKTQNKCDKAFNTSLFAIEFVPEYCKTQEICDKAVHTCPFAFDSVPYSWNVWWSCFRRTFYDKIIPW